MAENVEKCDGEDDPHRCQAMLRSDGQCMNRGVRIDEGYAPFCRVHGGNTYEEKDKKEKLRNYRLTKYQARLERHADSSQIKSLREEIGILRLILEERLNQCHNDTDLLLHSQVISDLVVKIEKVVASCHRLEGSLGHTLDKQAVLQFASEVIGVISAALEGQEDKIDIISEGIIEIVSRIGSDDTPAN